MVVVKYCKAEKIEGKRINFLKLQELYSTPEEKLALAFLQALIDDLFSNCQTPKEEILEYFLQEADDEIPYAFEFLMRYFSLPENEVRRLILKNYEQFSK